MIQLLFFYCFKYKFVIIINFDIVFNPLYTLTWGNYNENQIIIIIIIIYIIIERILCYIENLAKTS